MADNEDGFTGYQYLLDTKNSRQYAIKYENDELVKPIHVFAEDPREGSFNPNETVYALDDGIKFRREGNLIVASTQAYEFKTDGTGTPKRMEYAPVVEYNVFLESTPMGDIKVVYRMPMTSRDALAQAGISQGFPKEFSRELDPQDIASHAVDDGRGVDILELLKSLPFPPQHTGGGAVFARQNIAQIEKLSGNKQARSDFNKKSASIPAPPLNPKVSDADLQKVLNEFCEDLSAKAAAGKLDPVVGRDEEIVQAIKVLSRRKQSSLAFTGDAGVGKTAMFYGVTQYLNDGKNVPPKLRDARVLALNLQQMVAGTKYRGMFEERIGKLTEGLKEREGYFKGRKIILAIDEIHSALAAGGGGGEGGNSSAGNVMKPFLASIGISTMGATTGEEYRKHIEKDPALASRFEQMVLGQPDAASTKIILERLWPLYKEAHGLESDLTSDDFDYIVTMTNRYAPNEAQPRKGEKVLDMAGASAEFRGSDKIEREDIIAAVAQMSKLSIDFLSQGDHERFLKMREELPKEVLGQPGLQKVIDGLIGSRSGLVDPNQPWGAFVLQGPTGTGKTETCKALARYLFGSEDNLIQLNMAEFSEKFSVSRLIGAPPGYVGFEDSEPALTEKVRQRPYSIVLLDEIEKAHPDVFNILLPVFNDGKMTDNHGKTVQFNNVIFVMTTNLGAKEAMAVINGNGNGVNFGGSAEMKTPEEQQEALSKVYAKARTEFFKRPEMINRIEELGGFITFIPLATEVVGKLVDREMQKINKRLSDTAGAGVKGVTLEISSDVKAQLAVEGYKPDMGARPLRKVFREKVANPLGEWLMSNSEAIQKFVAEKGETKIVINSLGDFKPELVPLRELEPAATAVNDNAKEEAEAQAVTKKKKPPARSRGSRKP